MKKWVGIGLILLFSAGLAEARTAKPSQAKPASKTAAAAKKTVPAKKLAEKEDPYKGLIVMEAQTGKVLEAENEHLKRPPASVVKLMLAAVVLDKVNRGELKLTDKITVTREAAQMGGSQVYLEAGETFTLEEMMQAVLIASGNDAAYAVAEHVAGTAEAFVRMMNEKAKALNMSDTEFHSVHGLPPSKGQQEDLSSCSDLAILSRELLKYPKMLEWTSVPSAGFRDNRFIMNNHNKLLFKFPGTDGLKTGYYRETGFNVAATARRNDLRFIVVVMGSPSAKIRDNVAIEKFKKAFAQYKALPVVKKGDVIDREIVLADGNPGKIKGIAAADFVFPLAVTSQGKPAKEIVVPGKISGEVKQGQKLGDLVVKFDNQEVGRVDIVSPSSVPKANFLVRLLRRVGIKL